MNRFFCPTRICIEPGCSAFLSDVLIELGCGSALLVTDAGLLATGLPDRLRDRLDQRGIGVELFSEVEANPRTETAEAAALHLRGAGLEAVVALGGGSAIDAAKAAAMLASNAGSATSYLGKNRFRAKPLPLVAIPTTCGTGSEVTWVSVLSDTEKQHKISIKGDAMFPDWALVDADLISSLPAGLVASTGLDALTHALEACIVVQANPVSDAMARQAIGLLLGYLGRGYRDIAGDGEAREGLMRAATLAGLAFGSADVAAVHCISETLGGLYDIPHGLANAMLLVPVMRAHGDSVAGRLEQCAGSDDLLDKIEELTTTLDIPAFSSLEIDPADHPRIAQGAVANGSNGSNPRVMGELEYLEILESLS